MKKNNNNKGDQSWVFIGRTDVEAETPILWPTDVKSWLIWKDPDAGKDWGQEGKGTTEDEMVGWHHRLNGHVFGWTPGIGDGQGGLACCGSWDWATELNWKGNLTAMAKGQHFALVLATRRHNNSPESPRGIMLTQEQHGRILTQFCFTHLLS